MSLDLWSIAIIIIIFQGLFLLSILLSSREKRNKRGNSYLVFIILILIWFLVEFFSIRNKIEIPLTIFYGTRYGSWFLLGPLIHFYFKSITHTNWKFSKKQLWHFLPFIIFVVIVPLFAYRILNDRQVDYGMLSVFDHREKVLTILQWVYSFVFIIQFFHLGGFLIKNLNLSKHYKKGLTTEYSSIDPKINWLWYFNIILLFVLIFSAIFLYILLVTDIYRRHLDYIYVLPIGVLFYFISYKFIQTEWKPVEVNNKYKSSSLDENDVSDYTERLTKLIDVDKIYLNHSIRLQDIAEKMIISKHHLSQFINQHYNQTYYDFINKHRIEEAKIIIAKHPEYKLLQVAFDSGFNNKTSFVNAFKKFQGTTPSKYRETIEA